MEINRVSLIGLLVSMLALMSAVLAIGMYANALVARRPRFAVKKISRHSHPYHRAVGTNNHDLATSGRESRLIAPHAQLSRSQDAPLKNVACCGAHKQVVSELCWSCRP